MRALKLLLAVSLVVSACGGSSTPPTVLAPGVSDIPRIEFEKYSLANGLEVILSEDHRLPLVAVDIWYHVGPANEAAGRTGFAHLFEHMMFQGSKHVPGDSHFRLLEAAGGTNLNGTTNFDRTNYFETLPANQLELGALARVRSHGLSARHRRRGQAGQSAGRRAERAPSEHGERAVRPRRTKRCSRPCSRRRTRTSATSSDRTPTSRRPGSTT